MRFARPCDWLGEDALREVDGEAAAREVVRRYLGAYGPATREHFARWFGMTSPAQAGRWIRSLGDDVVPVEVEGVEAWLLAEDLEAALAAEPAGIVRLLPAFDHYVVAAPRDSEAVVPSEMRDRVYRAQGWISPVVLADGGMVGTWKQELAGPRLPVEVEPFAAPNDRIRRGVEAEAQRLARFLGAEPDLAWLAG